METLETSLEAAVRAQPASAWRGSRRHQIVRFLVLGDLLVLAVAAALAVSTVGDLALTEIATWTGTTLVATLAAFSFYRLYERDRGQIVVATLDEWRDFLNALSVLCLLEVVVAQTLGWDRVVPAETSTIAVYWCASLVLLPLARAGMRHVVLPRLNNQQNTVVVGAGVVGQMVARKIRKHREYNLNLVGFVDDEPHELDDLDDVPVLGGEDDLVEVIRANDVSRVVLAFSRRSAERLLEQIRAAGFEDVHLSIVPRYFELIASSVEIVDVEGIPIVEVPAARLSRLARFSKRAFDIALTLPGLLLIAPMLGLVALAIKLDSHGPVFFKQPRMGRGHEVFEIVKFRTMHVGAEDLRDALLVANESTGPLFKIREDPRVTRVGRWLRKLSLDELPQLLNVLRGEMSLVGPRPFVVYEDEKIDGWARRRLDLTPGITGLWQVLGRNDIGFEEMIKLDYLYVNNWSLWWDLKLLLRTAPVVLSRRGY
jgi:exopolysaccharide biosynthesis polyprenyl glycosylphosphotransferase